MAAPRSEVSVLIGTIRQLFHLLREAAAALHGELGVSASMRSVMESLSREGAATVPQLARERAVSRQHVQRTVDQLLERRLVHLESNPAHKRSPRIALTPRGEAQFRAMGEREKSVLERIARSLTASEAHVALRALGKMKSGLAPLVPRAHLTEEQQK
ncbi:MAG TPA: MarR family transcriptional regulator [Burkholderiales bacterium]|nr:MarR family transcriptional regulator [Burkholderiales bacterium]